MIDDGTHQRVIAAKDWTINNLQQQLEATKGEVGILQQRLQQADTRHRTLEIENAEICKQVRELEADLVATSAEALTQQRRREVLEQHLPALLDASERAAAAAEGDGAGHIAGEVRTATLAMLGALQGVQLGLPNVVEAEAPMLEGTGTTVVEIGEVFIVDGYRLQADRSHDGMLRIGQVAPDVVTPERFKRPKLVDEDVRRFIEIAITTARGKEWQASSIYGETLTEAQAKCVRRWLNQLDASGREDPRTLELEELLVELRAVYLQVVAISRIPDDTGPGEIESDEALNRVEAACEQLLEELQHALNSYGGPPAVAYQAPTPEPLVATVHVELGPTVTMVNAHALAELDRRLLQGTSREAFEGELAEELARMIKGAVIPYTDDGLAQLQQAAEAIVSRHLPERAVSVTVRPAGHHRTRQLDVQVTLEPLDLGKLAVDHKRGHDPAVCPRASGHLGPCTYDPAKLTMSWGGTPLGGPDTWVTSERVEQPPGWLSRLELADAIAELRELDDGYELRRREGRSSRDDRAHTVLGQTIDKVEEAAARLGAINKAPTLPPGLRDGGKGNRALLELETAGRRVHGPELGNCPACGRAVESITRIGSAWKHNTIDGTTTRIVTGGTIVHVDDDADAPNACEVPDFDGFLRAARERKGGA